MEEECLLTATDNPFTLRGYWKWKHQGNTQLNCTGNPKIITRYNDSPVYTYQKIEKGNLKKLMVMLEVTAGCNDGVAQAGECWWEEGGWEWRMVQKAIRAIRKREGRKREGEWDIRLNDIPNPNLLNWSHSIQFQPKTTQLQIQLDLNPNQSLRNATFSQSN